MVDHPPIENKGVGYINGNALISYFDILKTTKNERSINNRLNIALQRIHNNLIAESPVPGAPPVDQSENLVSRSGRVIENRVMSVWQLGLIIVRMYLSVTATLITLLNDLQIQFCYSHIALCSRV